MNTNNANTNAAAANADDGFDLQELALTKPLPFDLSAEFNATIMPMVDALTAKCKALGLPVFILTAYGQNEEVADYHAQAHMPSAERVPHLMLAAYMAGRGDFDGLRDVLKARGLRSLRAQLTTH